ncbi:calcium-responsive transcription factor-like [Elysia marginata]|uniref:Calcium-responsive transcription factor-like n=1 Tax=Elysia marginata TaxID=1093978 RepID=A0AAV4F0E0_9GAST|nr:calcium-responsive transcription factor-like [Elysia marginata]
MSVMTKDDVSEFEVDPLTTNDGPMWMELPLVSAAGLDDGVGEAGSAVVKLEEDEDIANLVHIKATEETEDHDVDPAQLVSVVGTGGNVIRANHATLQALLSTPVSGGQVFATAGGHEGGGLQVFALPQATEMVGLNTSAAADAAGTSSGGITTIDRLAGEQHFVQMIPTGTDLSGLATKYIGLIAIGNPGMMIQDKADMVGLSGLEMVQANESGELAAAAAENVAAFLMPPPAPPDAGIGLSGGVADRLVGDLSSLASKYGCLISQPELPPNCPSWATQLKNCEKIGDSYRGYVSNEVDLDVILTLHKQHTNSFWGTRQSPSPAKASTRLMWKSQYVPFDGIPFVNAGSRAVVMECQFGPRRKGTLGKRSAPSSVSTEFKQTCPARIYIKKVRKFPAYAVKLDQDKKSIRLAMDKAFHELREQGLDAWGEERFYVQLPTEKAHDYHDENTLQRSDPPHTQVTAQGTSQGYTGQVIVSGTKLPTGTASNSSSEVVGVISGTGVVISEQPPQRAPSVARIHPAVLDKLRQLVAAGETKLYAIRKQLRRFVVRELFQGTGQVPERHDLTMFPTVNDLKNHIHQALKDIESGVLPLSQNVAEAEHGSIESDQNQHGSSDIKPNLASLWTGETGDPRRDKLGASTPMPETVTVTLTQNPGEDGHHIISRIETHLSDGTTQVSTTLTPETAQLLSRLHPGLFPAGSLLQLESASSNSSSEASSSSPNPSHAGGVKGTGNSVSTKVTSREVLAATSSEKASIGLNNAEEGEADQHVISGVLSDPSQQLASFVGMDPETANSLSHMISGNEEEEGELDEEESVARSILVSQQQDHSHHRHHHHDSSQVKLSAQTEISSLQSEVIATDPNHTANIANVSCATNSMVVADVGRAAPSSSLSSTTLATSGSSVATHPLSILDTAAISQMMQSGAARLSIVPGHPNTLALVPADSVSTSLGVGLVAAHDPSDLDASDGHGHLSLDSEHLMMDRQTSSLEEDHDKLAQDKIQLHITADQEIGMAKLENQVSSL